MKKYFTTGLAILLPIILTIMIVGFLINFLTKPFLEPTKALLAQFDFFQHPFLWWNEIAFVAVASKIAILFILIGFIFLIGVLGKLFLIDAFFRFGNYLLHRLPFVNKIYKACQDIVHTVFSSSSSTFSQVVLVPFPNQHSLSVGLVTSDAIHSEKIPGMQHLVSVFVPGTPNPSVGFMLMLKREQLMLVNMKVDEAMKCIVSCGVVMPNFTIIKPSTVSDDQQTPNESPFLSSQEQFSQDTLGLCQSSRSHST